MHNIVDGHEIKMTPVNIVRKLFIKLHIETLCRLQGTREWIVNELNDYMAIPALQIMFIIILYIEQHHIYKYYSNLYPHEYIRGELNV